MRLPWLGAAAAAMWLAAGGFASAACPGTTVLFLDNFDRLLTTWGNAAAVAMKPYDGQLIVEPPADTEWWVANSAGLYDSIDMCVTITTMIGTTPDEAKAGLVFWYVDENNFYVFELAPNGKASVWRRQRGKWLAQVEWEAAPGAQSGDGAQNELRVTTVEDKATLRVNDQEFKTINGTPPEKGQQIGIFAASPAAGPARFAFDNLKVTKP
jgi:hypothetical protein